MAEGYEKFFGLFVERRVGAVCLAVSDVCSVCYGNVWSIREAVQRRWFVHKEDGVNVQRVVSGETVQ